MRYVVGVESGASRTDALVVDETGLRLGHGHSGPMYAGSGLDHANARVHLLDAVGEALANSGLSGAAIDCLFVSCSNWRAVRAADVITWIEPLDVRPAVVTVADEGDLTAAWAAAGWPDPALIVTLGTFWAAEGVCDGSVIPHLTDGLDVDQATADLAEGRTIGSLALRAALAAPYGGERTQLFEAICKAVDVEGVAALRQWARQNRTPEERARLCLVAAEVASAGDPVAQQIFKQAGVGLAQSLIPMAHAMGCATEKLDIVLSGNVWRAGALILDPFVATLQAALPQATVRHSPLQPYEGAALLALRQLGCSTTQLHG